MNEPLFFDCIPFARIWGGRQIEQQFGRPLPNDGLAYGESWEISDRPEFVSTVTEGKWKGHSLHDLWVNHQEELFGKGYGHLPAFPLLCKILDANDKLSIQVHPPASIARELGGDSKTEAWYVAESAPDAELYAGWVKEVTSNEIEAAITSGTLEKLIHVLTPRRGESLFLPSGRVHALGAGLVIFEIQENSDTTYRLYDWNRTDDQGNPRELHIEKGIQSLTLSDIQPEMRPNIPGELVHSREFIMEQIDLSEGAEAELAHPDYFSLLVIAEGSVTFNGKVATRGTFLILPRNSAPGKTMQGGARVIRCTVPVE